MEKIVESHMKFTKALNAFFRSIKRFSKDADEDEREGLYADIAKHYELCYESMLKFLDNYLIYNGHKVIGTNKSRNIFYKLADEKFISKDLSENLLHMATIRNFTVHEYDKDSVIDEIELIKSYYNTFLDVNDLLKIKLEFKNQ